MSRLAELWEDLKIRWFMLDAGQKQALLLLAAYAGYTLFDIAGALAKAKIGAKPA